MTKKTKKERRWKNTRKIGGKTYHFVQQSETKGKAKTTAKRIRSRYPNKKVRVVSTLRKQGHTPYSRPTRHAIYET